MDKKELQIKLIEKATKLTEELYGCDLDRLDPEDLNFYLKRVTEDKFEYWVSQLARAAWMEY